MNNKSGDLRDLSVDEVYEILLKIYKFDEKIAILFKGLDFYSI